MTSFMVVDDETGFCPTFPCERNKADSPGVSKDAFGAKRNDDEHV